MESAPVPIKAWAASQGVCLTTARNWKKTGRLPCRRIGGRVYILAGVTKHNMDTWSPKRIKRRVQVARQERELEVARTMRLLDLTEVMVNRVEALERAVITLSGVVYGVPQADPERERLT